MAKFIYRMQRILDIKEEEEKLQALIMRKAAYEDQGRELRSNALKVMEIMENRDAIAMMEEFIILQRRQVKKAEDQFEAARLKLQNAMQESKTQEKLREKAFDEFMREENAREAKEVDELVSYTHGRK